LIVLAKDQLFEHGAVVRAVQYELYELLSAN
jgi:hypothetical protein